MAIIAKTRKTDGIKLHYADFRCQHGHRHRECGGSARTDARKLLQQRLGDVRAGRYVCPIERSRLAEEMERQGQEAKGRTFGEYVSAVFLPEYGALRRSPYYRANLRPPDPMKEGDKGAAVMAHFAGRYLREITGAEIEAFLRERLREVGASTVRKNAILLHTVLRHARRRGEVAANVAVDLEKPPEPRHRTRYLTALEDGTEEWRRLYDAAEPPMKPRILLALSTGARLKEVDSLDCANLDWQEGMVYLSADNKTATPRAVPMGEVAREVLEDLGSRFRKSGPVFTDGLAEGAAGGSTARRRNWISQRTKVAAKAVGLEGVSFHTLRHSVGSWLAQAGYTELEIAWLLGHSAVTMTARYTHPHLDGLRRMVKTLDGRLRGVDPQMDSREVQAKQAGRVVAANASGSKHLDDMRE